MSWAPRLGMDLGKLRNPALMGKGGGLVEPGGNSTSEGQSYGYASGRRGFKRELGCSSNRLWDVFRKPS